MKFYQLNSIYQIFTCICDPVISGIYWICGCCFINKFKCEICNTRFNSKTNLARHIRESHSEIYAWGSSKQFKELLETEKLI